LRAETCLPAGRPACPKKIGSEGRQPAAEMEFFGGEPPARYNCTTGAAILTN